MKLFHNGLKDLLNLQEYTHKKLGFLSIETEIPENFKKFTTSIKNYLLGLHIRREYRHISMGMRYLLKKPGVTRRENLGQT